MDDWILSIFIALGVVVVLGLIILGIKFLSTLPFVVSCAVCGVLLFIVLAIAIKDCVSIMGEKDDNRSPKRMVR